MARVTVTISYEIPDTDLDFTQIATLIQRYRVEQESRPDATVFVMVASDSRSAWWPPIKVAKSIKDPFEGRVEEL